MISLGQVPVCQPGLVAMGFDAGGKPICVTTGPMAPSMPKVARARVWSPTEKAAYNAAWADWLKQSIAVKTSYNNKALEWMKANRTAAGRVVRMLQSKDLFSTQSQLDWYLAKVDPGGVKRRQAAATAAAAQAAAAHRARYAGLCKKIKMPPLDELGYDTLTVIQTTTGRRREEPASERAARRASLLRRNRAIKMHALGLGPVPSGGMPTHGPTLYWVPELAFKKEVCGSLTAAETARAIELGNAAKAYLHKRAKDKRKRRLKRLVAVAAVVVGAVYLGPMISGALKGTGAAGAAGGTGGASAAAAKGGAIAAKVASKAAVSAAVKGGAIATAGKVVTGAQLVGKAASKKAASTIVEKAVLTSAAEAVSIVDKARELIPKVVNVANNARTIKAIADGEIPPPPITLEGDSFTSYAGSLAQQLLEKEIRDKGQQLTEAELTADNAEIQREIDRLQRETAERLRRAGARDPIAQPLPGVDVGVEAGAARSGDMVKYALLAAPIAAAVLMRA